MRARQAKKILHYAIGGKTHKLPRYWYTRLCFYAKKPKGWNDHRITNALNVSMRHGRWIKGILFLHHLANFQRLSASRQM